MSFTTAFKSPTTHKSVPAIEVSKMIDALEYAGCVSETGDGWAVVKNPHGVLILTAQYIGHMAALTIVTGLFT